MARGAAGAAQSNLGTTNALGAQNAQQQQNLESTLIPDYQSMLTQGYTPQEQGAITTAGMGAIGSAYGGANADAARSAAATGNASNLTAQQDQLANQKGQAMGQEAAGLQSEFANQQQANQRFGLQGLAGQEAGNEGLESSMYGLGPSTINSWSNAQMNNPGMQLAGNLIGAAGAAAA